MDKETLSNYGWIVIAVLVLVVMIALATPFGKFVSQAVQNTTQGLFGVNQNALNAAGVPGLTIKDQKFDVPGNETQTPQEPEEETPAIVGSATFHMKMTEGCNCIESYGYHTCWTNIEPVTLTWDELKDPANGKKYNYDASKITDTEIGDDAFAYCGLIKLTIPHGVTTIGEYAISRRGLNTWHSFESIGPVGSGADLEIPSSVTTIGDNAFNFCGRIKSVILPEGIVTIGDYAFYECSALTSITLPTTLTTIGQWSFQECYSLTSITFGNTTAQWNTISKPWNWNYACPEITLTCTDGTIIIPAGPYD